MQFEAKEEQDYVDVITADEEVKHSKKQRSKSRNTQDIGEATLEQDCFEYVGSTAQEAACASSCASQSTETASCISSAIGDASSENAFEICLEHEEPVKKFVPSVEEKTIGHSPAQMPQRSQQWRMAQYVLRICAICR